nr:hypothetical protein [uncultured Campylobacter sp.]
MVFVLLVYLILTSLFSVDTPEGCDPGMPTSACDYIDEKFEKELQNLPPVAALPPLEKRPVFWLGKGRFAKGIKFDHLYVKNETGVWLRYKDERKEDLFLQKDMPGRYYGYDEIDRSPDEMWVRRELKYYEYGIYDISLFENEAKIFSQTAYKVVRKFIGFFNLHSMRGTSFAAPQGTEENLNAIRGLQIPLESFPKNPNEPWLVRPDKLEARGYSGDKIAKKLARNTFEIKGEERQQTVRVNSLAKDTKVVCGDEICLALAFDESKVNGCDNGAASTTIYTLNLKQKFRDFYMLPSKNFKYAKISDNFTLDDVKSFEIILSKFRDLGGLDKGSEYIDYEVILRNGEGEQVNEICRNQTEKVGDRTQ